MKRTMLLTGGLFLVGVLLAIHHQSPLQIEAITQLETPERYRGTGVHLACFAHKNNNLKDLEDLKYLGANLIRLDIWKPGNIPMSVNVISGIMPDIISVLDKCTGLDMKVVIALIDMPGGRNLDNPKEHYMYYDRMEVLKKYIRLNSE